MRTERASAPRATRGVRGAIKSVPDSVKVRGKTRSLAGITGRKNHTNVVFSDKTWTPASAGSVPRLPGGVAAVVIDLSRNLVRKVRLAAVAAAFFVMVAGLAI